MADERGQQRVRKIQPINDLSLVSGAGLCRRAAGGADAPHDLQPLPLKGEEEHDARNGPARLREAPWEWEYHRKIVRGEYVDRFHAPRYTVT